MRGTANGPTEATTMAEVLDELRRLAADELGLPDAASIAPGARLVEDLGLDSLTLTALAVAVEDRFRVILDDEEGARVRSVEDLARLVLARRLDADAGASR
jgi:acyl carrier protein